MRRISVHSGDGNVSATVDLALPSAVSIAELLPSIVDTIAPPGADSPLGWRLCRVAGAVLDHSMTLLEAGVRDGEVLLLLRHEPPPPVFGSHDLATVVVEATPDGPDARVLTSAAAAWTVAAGALALAGAGVMSGAAAHLVTIAALAAAAGTAAVVVERARPDPWWSVTLQHVAVLLAAVVGFRAVPGGPGPANVLLAVAAATVTSMVLLRCSIRPSVWMGALAATGSIVTVAVGAAVVWALPTAVLGAALAVLGLSALSCAARLSVVLAGLAPTGHAPEGDAELLAARGHRLLIALVAGTSGAASVGVALVAVGGIRTGAPWQVDAGFCGAVGVALLLRSRSHAGGWCRTALVAAGMLCLTAGFVVLSAMAAGQAFWVALATVAAGSVALSPAAHTAAGPVAARAVDAFEYAALTAVVPLACWLTGLFAAVRGWQVP